MRLIKSNDTNFDDTRGIMKGPVFKKREIIKAHLKGLFYFLNQKDIFKEIFFIFVFRTMNDPRHN